MTSFRECTRCGGSGRYSFEPCRECKGTGMIEDDDPGEEDFDYEYEKELDQDYGLDGW